MYEGSKKLNQSDFNTQNLKAKEENISVFCKEILSSSHINFLFGAGVNGNALPQLDKFTNTKHLINQKINDSNKTENLDFEECINLIENEDDREKIKQVFIAEFKNFHKTALKKLDNGGNDSLNNLKDLLSCVYGIVKSAQNRNPSMKQINVYTLNYDDIVETLLDRLGYLHNTISASTSGIKASLMDVIGYDYTSRKYVPTFMVSKLHGDISNPIIPGKEKYKEVLNDDYFEIVFKMKEQLCRPNSCLIVIGYSGKDKHINKIIQDCINSGLTIYWFKYSENDNPPKNWGSGIKVKEQADYKSAIDSTKLCYEDFITIWV